MWLNKFRKLKKEPNTLHLMLIRTNNKTLYKVQNTRDGINFYMLHINTSFFPTAINQGLLSPWYNKDKEIFLFA